MEFDLYDDLMIRLDFESVLAAAYSGEIGTEIMIPKPILYPLNKLLMVPRCNSMKRS